MEASGAVGASLCQLDFCVQIAPLCQSQAIREKASCICSRFFFSKKNPLQYDSRKQTGEKKNPPRCHDLNAAYIGTRCFAMLPQHLKAFSGRVNQNCTFILWKAIGWLLSVGEALLRWSMVDL